jgi:hypothetical protein
MMNIQTKKMAPMSQKENAAYQLEPIKRASQFQTGPSRGSRQLQSHLQMLFCSSHAKVLVLSPLVGLLLTYLLQLLLTWPWPNSCKPVSTKPVMYKTNIMNDTRMTRPGCRLLLLMRRSMMTTKTTVMTPTARPYGIILSNARQWLRSGRHGRPVNGGISEHLPRYTESQPILHLDETCKNA